MITIFVKFTNHADELLNGHIRMNPLEYYRGVEKILSGNTSELDNPAVYDVLEGSAGYIPIDDCVKFGIHFSDEEKEHFRGMHLLDETAKYLKLFCLYQWHFFPEKGTAVRLPNELNQFGKDAVIIKNKKTLLDRMLGSIRALENFHMSFIKYKTTKGWTVVYCLAFFVAIRSFDLIERTLSVIQEKFC